MRSRFPPGWAAATIGDVFEIVGGSTPRTGNPDYWDGDIPWLTPDDLSTHQGVLVSSGRRSITEAGFASTSTHMLPKNSILFSSRAPIGYTAVAANPLCTNQGFKSLIPPAGVESRYVYWYLRHATPTIRELGSGTTFRELSKKRMNAVPFVLAPTAEQGRIVTAIEEHSSRLDAVDNALTAAQRRLDALLQSALRSSCEGSWATRPLSDIIKSLKNGVFVSRPTAKPPGYPIYRSVQFGPCSSVSTTSVTPVPFQMVPVPTLSRPETFYSRDTAATPTMSAPLPSFYRTELEYFIRTS